jgi:hypothetical protein
MAFNLQDYEPVASRIQRFYEAYPTGAIHCEIVHDDGQRVIIKATVWRDINDARPAAVDYAEELLTDRGVNSTSRIENCATSATGRAISIAAHGLGPSDWTKKPSREEMEKVQRSSNGPAYERGNDPRMPSVTITQPAGLATDKQKNMIRAISKSHGALPPANLDQMTKFEASAHIDKLKTMEGNAKADEQDMNAEEPF